MQKNVLSFCCLHFFIGILRRNMEFTFEDFVLLSSLEKSDFKVKNQEGNTAKAAETYFMSIMQH